MSVIFLEFVNNKFVSTWTWKWYQTCYFCIFSVSVHRPMVALTRHGNIMTCIPGQNVSSLTYLNKERQMRIQLFFNIFTASVNSQFILILEFLDACKMFHCFFSHFSVAYFTFLNSSSFENLLYSGHAGQAALLELDASSTIFWVGTKWCHMFTNLRNTSVDRNFQMMMNSSTWLKSGWRNNQNFLFYRHSKTLEITINFLHWKNGEYVKKNN